MKYITCCKDCTKRYLGCHGKCEEYKAEVENHKTHQSKIRAEKDKDNQAIFYAIENTRKIRKRLKNQK